VIVRTEVVGSLATNCYLVWDEETKEGIVIDPGSESGKILRAIEEIGLVPQAIVLTHGHGDHTGAVGKIKKETLAPVLIHEKDASFLTDPGQAFLDLFLATGEEAPPPADRFVVENDKIEFGKESLAVLYTPGHTPGSISLAAPGLVFTGDALFAGSIGRTDLPGGSYQTLIKSIKEKIMTLDDETIVYPGHGPVSKVGFERRTNPFL
jgi:glyoxylase-like metal-dependent hydrolase (beta-lactamase superfamily II)